MPEIGDQLAEWQLQSWKLYFSSIFTWLSNDGWAFRNARKLVYKCGRNMIPNLQCGGKSCTFKLKNKGTPKPLNSHKNKMVMETFKNCKYILITYFGNYKSNFVASMEFFHLKKKYITYRFCFRKFYWNIKNI